MGKQPKDGNSQRKKQRSKDKRPKKAKLRKNENEEERSLPSVKKKKKRRKKKNRASKVQVSAAPTELEAENDPLFSLWNSELQQPAPHALVNDRPASPLLAAPAVVEENEEDPLFALYNFAESSDVLDICDLDVLDLPEPSDDENFDPLAVLYDANDVEENKDSYDPLSALYGGQADSPQPVVDTYDPLFSLQTNEEVEAPEIEFDRRSNLYDDLPEDSDADFDPLAALYNGDIEVQVGPEGFEPLQIRETQEGHPDAKLQEGQIQSLEVVESVDMPARESRKHSKRKRATRGAKEEIQIEGEPEHPVLQAKRERVKNVCLVLYRNHEVRTRDFDPLQAAVKSKQPNFDLVVPFFLWSDCDTECRIWGSPLRAACAEVYVAVALQSLREKLRASYDSDLIFRKVWADPGASIKALTKDYINEIHSFTQEIQNQVGGQCKFTLHAGFRFEPQAREFDTLMWKALKRDMRVHLFNTSMLYDPERVPVDMNYGKRWNGHWGTLMPFYRLCRRKFGEPARPTGPLQRSTKVVLRRVLTSPESLTTLVVPNDLVGVSRDIRDPFEEVGWMKKVVSNWNRAPPQPTGSRKVVGFPLDEDTAYDAMMRFVHGPGLRQYGKKRGRIDVETAVSRLSPCIKWGLISPQALHWAVKENKKLAPAKKAVFGRRMYWRDLSYYQLRCFPDMHTVGIRKHYDQTEWDDPNKLVTDKILRTTDGPKLDTYLNRYKYGFTGFPLVDAGMRELQETGWMQQNVRMVVASFLVDYLGWDWRVGFRIFHDCLIDADLAINAMMWQNAGGSGVDQWNMVLRPTNGERRDPEGIYVKRWCPELQGCSDLPLLFDPHQIDRRKEHARRKPMSEYPRPLVTNLDAARRKVLDRMIKMRRANPDRNDKDGYDIICLPRRQQTSVFTKRPLRLPKPKMPATGHYLQRLQVMMGI